MGRVTAVNGLALLPATQPGSAKPNIRKFFEIQTQRPENSWSWFMPCLFASVGKRRYIAATKSGSMSGALTCKSCAIRAAIPVYIEATWKALERTLSLA